MPIDPQTGCELGARCECKPCEKCGGEGEHEGFSVRPPYALGIVLCTACLGTGRDSSMCEIEHKEEWVHV